MNRARPMAARLKTLWYTYVSGRYFNVMFAICAQLNLATIIFEMTIYRSSFNVP